MVVRHAALALVALALSVPGAHAQSRLLNGGFEEHSACPRGPGDFDVPLDLWTSTSVASTDYHHACGFTSHAPRTGDGCIGLLALDSSANYREYATGRIDPPLVAGRVYELAFWVIKQAGYLDSIVELGAHFSETEPSWPGTGPPAGVVADFENATGLLDDTIAWREVTGTYVAAGGEAYVTLGNFRDDANTTSVHDTCCGSFGAYYFIDDVRLLDTSPRETCLHRAEMTSLTPPTPSVAELFEPGSPLMPDGVPYQCPLTTGDLESDPNALNNGFPLVFYQVNVPDETLMLNKFGTTIRFRW
jgi:hypothetical protein